MRRFIVVFALLLSIAPALAQPLPVKLDGAVKAPLVLDQATLAALPAISITVSFKTDKGPETGVYTGVLLWDLLQKAGLVNAAGKNTILRHTLLISGRDGYAVAVAIGEIDPDFAGKSVIIAYRGAAGASFDHLRLVVPGDAHGSRSVNDIAGIEVN